MYHDRLLFFTNVFIRVRIGNVQYCTFVMLAIGVVEALKVIEKLIMGMVIPQFEITTFMGPHIPNLLSFLYAL